VVHASTASFTQLGSGAGSALRERIADIGTMIDDDLIFRVLLLPVIGKQDCHGAREGLEAA
jgi:hypothetical protein